MQYLLIATVSLLHFAIYLYPSRRLAALLFLAGTIGYQMMSYQHYFGGGWEAAGNIRTFNRELVLSTIVLTTLSSVFGFAAWALHHVWHVHGEGFRAKLRTFGLAGVALVLVAGGLVAAVPLSFEAPIDLKRCDGSADQPQYCP